jgi:hypothetical protein
MRRADLAADVDAAAIGQHAGRRCGSRQARGRWCSSAAGMVVVASSATIVMCAAAKGSMSPAATLMSRPLPG